MGRRRGHEVYLRSFSDGGDDGIGDCAGLIERLDCLDELGIDIVWVTPFYPSPQADFDYDVADCRGVDPMSGTIDERDPEAIDGELITRSTM